MLSSAQTNQVVKPTEQLLRKFFMRFGSVSDIQVNWYDSSPLSRRQEGYGFVTLFHRETYESVLMNPTHVIDGITLICTATKHSR